MTTAKLITEIMDICQPSNRDDAAVKIKALFKEYSVSVAIIKDWSQDEIENIPMESKPAEVEPPADEPEVKPATIEDITEAFKRLGDEGKPE